jgi:DNA-directed RNA polymerase subunit RPC12/RpoP
MIAERVTSAAETRPRGGAKRLADPSPEPAVAGGATCSECGGSLRINEGDRSVRCGYCGSALLVTTPRGVQSFILRPKITPAKARLAAIRYIAEQTNRRLGTRRAAIVDQKLIHVPFWRLRGRLMGWISGEKTARVKVETVSDGPGGANQARTIVREERTPCSRLLFKRVDWSAPACVLPSLGLQGISLRTGFLDWDVLDDKARSKHTVALPVRSDRLISRDALGFLERLAVPAGTDVRAKRFRFFDSRLSLHYYPVYLLRYTSAGRIYAITIDGGNGAVVRGEVPRRRRIDSKRLFFAPAALAFLAATWPALALVPLAVLYALDAAREQRFLLPHAWAAMKINGLLGSED